MGHADMSSSTRVRWPVSTCIPGIRHKPQGVIYWNLTIHLFGMALGPLKLTRWKQAGVRVLRIVFATVIRVLEAPSMVVGVCIVT